MHKTRIVVMTAIVSALYISTTLFFAPISYGLIQFRVSESLKVLALYSPIFSLGFGLGTFISNLASPFGFYDWGIMPLVDIFAALVCFYFRRSALIALLLQSFIISIGVAVFPLGLGARLPVGISFISVFFSQTIILLGAYFIIWKPYSYLIHNLVSVWK